MFSGIQNDLNYCHLKNSNIFLFKLFTWKTPGTCFSVVSFFGLWVSLFCPQVRSDLSSSFARSSFVRTWNFNINLMLASLSTICLPNCLFYKPSFYYLPVCLLTVCPSIKHSICLFINCLSISFCLSIWGSVCLSVILTI